MADQGADPVFTVSEKLLATVGARAVVRKYPRNSIVLDEGDRSDTLYLVRSGKVKVYVADEHGRELVLNVIGPGEYFGEIALDGGPRSAAAMTLEPCVLLVVPGADVKRMLAADAQFALSLLFKLTDRIRALTDKVKALALQDVYGRLARLLGELSVETDGANVIEGRLTHQAIAERIGASREMVSRLLKDLVDGGYLSIEKRRIVVNRKLPLQW
jgi:CRP/FNR family cyclic AMP-dependent transcriptional regulator